MKNRKPIQDEAGLSKWETKPGKNRNPKFDLKKLKSTEPKVPRFDQGKKNKRIKLRDHQWGDWE